MPAHTPNVFDRTSLWEWDRHSKFFRCIFQVPSRGALDCAAGDTFERVWNKACKPQRLQLQGCAVVACRTQENTWRTASPIPIVTPENSFECPWCCSNLVHVWDVPIYQCKQQALRRTVSILWSQSFDRNNRKTRHIERHIKSDYRAEEEILAVQQGLPWSGPSSRWNFSSGWKQPRRIAHMSTWCVTLLQKARPLLVYFAHVWTTQGVGLCSSVFFRSIP